MGGFAKVDNVFLRLGGFAKVDNRFWLILSVQPQPKFLFMQEQIKGIIIGGSIGL